MRLIRWIVCWFRFALLYWYRAYKWLLQTTRRQQRSHCMFVVLFREKGPMCRHSPVWLLQQPCQLGEGLGQQSCTYWECYGMFKVSTDLLHHMNHIPAVAWTKEKQNIRVMWDVSLWSAEDSLTLVLTSLRKCSQVRQAHGPTVPSITARHSCLLPHENSQELLSGSGPTLAAWLLAVKVVHEHEFF